MTAPDGTSIGPRLKPILAQRQADVDKAKEKRSMGNLTGAIAHGALLFGLVHVGLALREDRLQAGSDRGPVGRRHSARPLMLETRMEPARSCFLFGSIVNKTPAPIIRRETVSRDRLNLATFCH